MSKTPSSSSGWSTKLLLLITAVAIIPPSTAFAKFSSVITHNPVITAVLLVTYELVVGLFTIITAFAKKIWERRADTWADASAGRLEKAWHILFAGANRRYNRFFCFEHGDLDMKGISTRGTYTLALEQVFVELRIDPTPAHQISSDPIRLPSELRAGVHDIWDYLTRLDQHLVILGAPGSGKTTLLKHLGLTITQPRSRRKAGSQRIPWRVPLFLPLREQSSLLKEQPDSSLVDAVNRQISKWKQAIPSVWVEHCLQQGRCLVLLDGLDEIADETQRQGVVDWVQHQMLVYSANRFIITSRPLGYRTKDPLDRVTILEVQSFTFDQITRFLRSWYVANEIKRAVRDDPGVRMKASEGAEDLLERLRTTPALYALAVNPLLLTMIATVHLYYGTLPGARITLYKAICEVFLNKRQQVPNSSQELRAEQRQLVLQSLAYTLMQQGKRDVSHEEACQIIQAPLEFVSTSLTPELFLKHLEAISSGLLLEREQGIYSFAHLTFQEYLAMMHLQENHLEQELLIHIEESWWHEIIRLYCAQGDATPIIEACLVNASHSFEALTLAIDCVEEARNIQATVKEHLYRLLEQGVNDADPKRRRVIAEALLKRRLRQMSPLTEKTYVDNSLVTCVEYQLFLDEETSFVPRYRPDYWNENAFPQGQGQNPILGVRASDAEAFCYWLTNRDREGWLYRLPRSQEREQIITSIGTKLQEDTAYWQQGADVVWTRSGPSLSLLQQVSTIFTNVNSDVLDSASASTLTNIRTNTLANILAYTLASTPANDLASTLARTLDLASALARTLDLASALAHANTQDLALTLTRDLTRQLLASTNAFSRAFSSDEALIQDLALDLNNAHAHARQVASDLTSATAHVRQVAFDRNNVRASDLTSAQGLALAITQDLAHAYIRTLVFARDLAYDLALNGKSDPSYINRTYIIKIYTILFLFVQRPKGRLPAYEGILLMKERAPEISDAP